MNYLSAVAVVLVVMLWLALIISAGMWWVEGSGWLRLVAAPIAIACLVAIPMTAAEPKGEERG